MPQQRQSQYVAVFMKPSTKYDGGEGGLFIYESVRPIGHCFIFFDAEGNVEKVVTRNLD